MQQHNLLLVEKASEVAAMAHAGQVRKSSGEPYITHPEAVAAILRNYGTNEETIAAAMLHDVLEDCSDVYSQQDMERDFSHHIVELVLWVSEDKAGTDGRPIPWSARKESYIANLEHAPDEALLVSMADKIHNLESVLGGYVQIGDKVWSNFKSTPQQQLWYYGTLTKLFSSRFGAENQLVRRLAASCDRLMMILPTE